MLTFAQLRLEHATAARQGTNPKRSRRTAGAADDADAAGEKVS
jgi:hypothetical protein